MIAPDWLQKTMQGKGSTYAIDSVSDELTDRPGRVIAEVLFLVSRIFRTSGVALSQISRRGRPRNIVESAMIADLARVSRNFGIRPSSAKASKFHNFVCDIFELVGLNPDRVEGQLAGSLPVRKKQKIVRK